MTSQHLYSVWSQDRLSHDLFHSADPDHRPLDFSGFSRWIIAELMNLNTYLCQCCCIASSKLWGWSQRAQSHRLPWNMWTSSKSLSDKNIQKLLKCVSPWIYCSLQYSWRHIQWRKDPSFFSSLLQSSNTLIPDLLLFLLGVAECCLTSSGCI